MSIVAADTGRAVETPVSLIYRSGKRETFVSLPVGAMFVSNGNLWQKRTSRTAIGHWPAYLPEWAYFGKNEVVTHDA